MAIQSVQYAGTVGTPRVKIAPVDNGNGDKTIFATTPAVYASQAINEIFDIGFIPAGSRLMPWSTLECAAGAASSTLNIGIRRASNGAVISATQIASAANLSAAGLKNLNNGAAFNGSGYVTPEDVIVFGTFTGAASQANQAISVYISYVPASA